LDLKLTVNSAEYFYNTKNGGGFTNINFTIESGEFLCLLGPNGCGKTTLLKSLNRLIPVNKGQIEINGRNIANMPRVEIARQIGYVPQLHQPAFPFTVLEVVLMGRAPHLGPFSSPHHKDIIIAEEAMDIIGISSLRDKPYTQLSGGERQLVVFARVLAQKPSLILLDEPTSHLDFANQVRLLNTVEQLSKTGIPIIMTSHFPDHAFMVSNKVALMKKGEILDVGIPENVITENNLERVYDMKVKVVTINTDINRKVCLPVGESQTGIF
jgi:iron complex transport system ATP-binding protein